MKIGRLAPLLVLLAVTPVKADDQVAKLFTHVRHINPTMKDYSAELTLKLDAMLGFIPYHPEMSGAYYYKSPDKHKLDLKKAPNYLKKYPSVFGFNMPRLDWYDSKVVEETMVGGEMCYHLSLVKHPEVDSNNITHLEIYINKANYTVPRYDSYYDNGHLFVNSYYKLMDGPPLASGEVPHYWVFERMTADFEGSAVTVKAVADYKNYKFNSNLPDSLFKRP